MTQEGMKSRGQLLDRMTMARSGSAFFIEYILTCHIWKSTGASVSGSRYCACGSLSWLGAVVNVLNNTCDIPAMTSQKIYCEKRPAADNIELINTLLKHTYQELYNTLLHHAELLRGTHLFFWDRETGIKRGGERHAANRVDWLLGVFAWWMHSTFGLPHLKCIITWSLIHH